MAELTGVLSRQVYRRPNRFRELVVSLTRSATGLAGLVIIVAIVGTAIFAPALAPSDPTSQNLRARLTPPVWESGNSDHVLGTDALGRDILSRLIYGSRIALIVGVVSAIIAGVLGTAIGLISGFYGRTIDTLLMRFADIQLSVPSLILYLTILIVLGPGLRNMVLSLGVASWVTFGRVTRSEVMALKNTQFVDAARSVGQRDLRIMLVHVLPNVVNSVIVLSTLVIGTLILAAAGLSFLGLGISPTTPAWGNMVADGRDYIQVAWWISTIPGVAIFVAVLGFNLFGDWLRDYLDPRLRHR